MTVNLSAIQGREVETSDCATICCLEYRWPNIATTKFYYILLCHSDVFRSTTFEQYERQRICSKHTLSCSEKIWFRLAAVIHDIMINISLNFMTFLTSNAMLIPYLCRHLLLCSRQGQTLVRILWEAVQTRSTSQCTSHHPVWDGIFLKHALFVWKIY